MESEENGAPSRQYSQIEIGTVDGQTLPPVTEINVGGLTSHFGKK